MLLCQIACRVKCNAKDQHAFFGRPAVVRVLADPADPCPALTCRFIQKLLLVRPVFRFGQGLALWIPGSHESGAVMTGVLQQGVQLRAVLAYP